MSTAGAPVPEALRAKLSDRWWRLNNLYWVQDVHGRKVRFKPNAVQAALYWNLWWLSVILKSRQHGISTMVVLMQLDQCLFNSTQTCGLIDITADDAKKKLAKLRYAYDHLDDPDDPRIAPLGAAIKAAVPIKSANTTEVEWENGSQVWSGTSLRGGTVQWLHVTELGKISVRFPLRAEEIRAGALNTVHAGSKITIESTHEGGKAGLNYEMIVAAQACLGRKLSPMDWQFFFFAWYEDPKNVLPFVDDTEPLRLTEEQQTYFRELAPKILPRVLTDEQINWYVAKEAIQKHAMRTEYPSTADEAVNAVVRGAIYGEQISILRQSGRVTTFEHDRTAPIITAWDLGQSDYTGIWLIQPVGYEYLVLNYDTARGRQARYYAALVMDWERRYGPISFHFLPHDGWNAAGGGMSWAGALAEAGIHASKLKRVPRTPDVWIGINHARTLLPRCRFHAAECSRDVDDGGTVIPGGLAALEGYRTHTIDHNGGIREMPVHDHCSHGADAFRTFAEAEMRGMLGGLAASASRTSRAVRVITTDPGDRTNRQHVLRRVPHIKVRR